MQRLQMGQATSQGRDRETGASRLSKVMARNWGEGLQGEGEMLPDLPFDLAAFDDRPTGPG